MSAGPPVSTGLIGPADLADQLDPSEELVAPSTTARTLRRLRIWLVLACLAAGAVSLFVFSRAHYAVDKISNRSAPAVEQADAAYVAVAKADSEAVSGLNYAGVLDGTSAAYQIDLATANQSLSQLLADNVAGPEATSLLQLVQELVVGYNQQVEQAYADLAQDYSNDVQHNPLAVVDIYYSTSLADGLTKDLRMLRDDEQSALATQQSSTWLASTGYLVWTPVVVAAVALILATDFFVRRRFRRRVNVGLTGAALALVAMGMLCGLSLWVSDGDLTAGVNHPLANVTDLADAQHWNASIAAKNAGFDLVRQICPDEQQCGAQFTDQGNAPPDAALTDVQLPQGPSASESDFAGAAAVADTAYVVRAVIIAVLALVATVLAVLGLWRRIGEYRFEA